MGFRAEFMLLGDGERPRATGWGRAVAECTIGFLLVVRAVVRQLWEAREEDIKAKCAAFMPTGLIDEMDVLAFVLADAFGKPLLHHQFVRQAGRDSGDTSAEGH